MWELSVLDSLGGNLMPRAHISALSFSEDAQQSQEIMLVPVYLTVSLQLVNAFGEGSPRELHNSNNAHTRAFHGTWGSIGATGSGWALLSFKDEHKCLVSETLCQHWWIWLSFCALRASL